MVLALNGNAGPVRRPVWRLKEATYVRYAFLGFVSFYLIRYYNPHNVPDQSGSGTSGLRRISNRTNLNEHLNFFRLRERFDRQELILADYWSEITRNDTNAQEVIIPNLIDPDHLIRNGSYFAL
jgi:hypothetical protein